MGVILLKYNHFIYKKNQINNPKLRIIINHHAGGSSASYFKFCEYFPNNWDICFLDLPCRGIDFFENPIKNREDLYLFFDKYLKNFNDIPLALFGHSMGAHIAYEMAHYLKQKKDSPLVWLGVSGKKAPNIFKKEISTPVYLNTNESLTNWLKSIGGTPSEFFESPDLLEFFLPILRNDLSLYYNLENQLVCFNKLDVPISIFSGISDEKALPNEMSKWKEFTLNKHFLNEFEGGHFYFQGKEEVVANKIIENIVF